MFILIIFYIVGANSALAVSSVEFLSKESCEVAQKQVEQETNLANRYKSFCVKK